MQKYYIITFGCQMNISDSERIATVLDGLKYKPTPNINEANLIVVNMCSVRQSAVDRIYGLVQKFKKLKTLPRSEPKVLLRGINYKLKTILTGCILKKDRRKFQKIFDYILDIKDLLKWPKILNIKKSQFHSSVYGTARNYLEVNPKYSVKFSAFIPIMTGCNNFCAYCVVPYARGKETPRPAEEIICETKKAVKNGAKEIWLLGQNVNSYKDPIQFSLEKSDRFFQEKKRKKDFPWLIRKINKIPDKFWIRFTSSHPKDFSDDLINAMADCEKVTEYLNLPIQAGDNQILKKMNRPYTVAQYKNLVQKIRKKIPGISLSTDVIVGFPGETKRQFENTAKLFKEIKFDMAYIAKYSPRPGTAAAKMENNVQKKEKNRRAVVLTDILRKTALEKNQKYIGKKVETLIETKKSKNSWLGKTKEYKTIQFKSNKNLLGKFIKAEIINALPWGLEGKLL